MQWLAMIITYFFGRRSSKSKSLKEIALEVYEEISAKSRRLITLTLSGLGAVILFCGGFFVSLLELTSQYDRVGYVSLSATLAAGLTLMICAVVAFMGIFWGAWPNSTQHSEHSTQESTAQAASPLENALSVLIMDYVKDRELRRESRRYQSTDQPSPPSHSPPPPPIH